jgi:hypothetical protein
MMRRVTMAWLVLFGMAIVSLLLIVFPNKVVSWHAGLWRRHHSSERDQAMMDKLQELDPFSRWMIGKMSTYIREGVEAPEHFPRMVALIRLIGITLELACLAAVVLVFMGPS